MNFVKSCWRTSVGSPERMKALIPLITDDERKVVVLSAMSGTTNSLIEISDLLYSGNTAGALNNYSLSEKYHKIVTQVYETEAYKKAVLN